MVTLDLVVLAAYLIGILWVGIAAQRKATTQEDFLVAGRSVGPVLYAGTLAAVILGGGATVGRAEGRSGGHRPGALGRRRRWSEADA